MKKRILLVEDDAALWRVTEVMLRSNGYEVRHVTDGRVALAELSRAAWDLVLTDVRMPAMDGLELLDWV